MKRKSLENKKYQKRIKRQNPWMIKKESSHPDYKRPYCEIVIKFFQSKKEALKWAQIDFCSDVCEELCGGEEDDVPETSKFIEWIKEEKFADGYMDNHAIQYTLYNLSEISNSIPEENGEIPANKEIADLNLFAEKVRLYLIDWIKWQNTTNVVASCLTNKTIPFKKKFLDIYIYPRNKNFICIR
jgi:hypothetical protein